MMGFASLNPSYALNPSYGVRRDFGRTLSLPPATRTPQ